MHTHTLMETHIHIHKHTCKRYSQPRYENVCLSYISVAEIKNPNKINCMSRVLQSMREVMAARI